MAILEQEMQKATRQSERIENQAIRELKGIYKQSEDVILDLVAQRLRKHAPEEMNKYGRMDALERDVYQEIGKMTQRERNTINYAIAAAFLSAYGRTAFGIEKEVQAKLAYREPLVRSAGKGARTAIEVLQQRDFKQLAIQRTTTLTRMQIQRDLVTGMAQGEGYREIAKRVNKTLLSEDSDSSFFRAARITRTECHNAREEANFEALKHASEKGVNFVRMWLATKDNRTRDAHGAMDGQRVGVDEPFTAPSGETTDRPGGFGVASLDINCRCSVIAIVDDIEPEVMRVRGEGVIPYKTYDEYMADKSWMPKYKGFKL